MKSQRITMLKSIATVLLFAVAVSSQAQTAASSTEAAESAPTPAQMASYIQQAKPAQTILAAGVSADKVDNAFVSYVNDKQQWQCLVVLKADKSAESATASSPERACVQLLIKLAHRRVI